MDHSFVVFGPQGAAPSVPYLQSIREFIINHPVIRCIYEDIGTLKDVWTIVAEKNKDVAALPQAPQYMNYFTQWLIDDKAENIASIASSIVALPRLYIIHVVQYFQFLERKAISHAEFTSRIRKTGGGFQGYCGGMPAAVSLASAKDDRDLSQNLMAAIRLAFAIGLYTELGDDTRAQGLAIMVVRVEKEEQAEELVAKFPRTYISAFTDPRNISVVGPTKQLEDLMAHAVKKGFMVQPLEIRGKVHNPENMDLADELSALCGQSELMRLPSSDQLQCPVRSNRDGALISPGKSLSDDVLYTIMASRSEWYKVLQGVAEDLKTTGIESHSILSLGIGDFIPLMPFNKLGLRMKKVEWSGPEAKGKATTPPPYSHQEDAIAIVGASCRLPGANNMEELWELLEASQDRHEVVKPDRVNMYNSYRSLQSGNFAKNRKWYGNFVDGVDCFDGAFFGTNPREMANMDPQQRMLLELAYEAMECYGYTKSHVRSHGDNVGCFIGASFTEYLENAYAYKPTAYTAPGTIRAFLCGRISYHFGWTGPSEVIDTACSASLVAVSRAVKAIRTGECPVALAGGVNVISGVHNYLDLARAGFLSATGQCKPWDKDADGYCRSDGVGLVVLKSLKQAQADGDHIMAVIAGAATNQGGLSSSITNPDPIQQARLYRDVLGQADLRPEQVTYVEAHGTGTQAGDKIETSSIREVFGSSERPKVLNIGSIKGNIGHCETAAGVAGLLKVVSMLEHQAIPPQASHKAWNPKIPALAPDRMAIPMSLKGWDASFRAALVNSFGAAGSNATVLCCEAPPQTARSQSSRLRQPIVLSAQSISSLGNYRISLGKYLAKALKTHQPPSINDLAYTLSEKRRRHKYALVLEASSTEELAGMLLAGDERPIVEPREKPVVLVFGGQSKQTIGLGTDMYEQFDIFRKHLDTCDHILQQLSYPSIVPAVFQNDNLEDIVVLQTGHVSVQYAAALTWIEAGIHIDAVVGHSLGELSALAISGRLSIYECLRLVAERASLMQKSWGAEKGAMLAVFASRSAVETAITHLENSANGKCKLEIACYNSETSQVVSGDCGSIAELERYLSEEHGKTRYTRVDTSHGFHSRLVEPILDDLEKVSASLEWQPATIPIEMCVAGPTIDKAAPYSPSRHARDPVFFADAIQRLEQRLGEKGCVWLEAGVDTPIMAMTKRAVSQSPHQHDHTFIDTSTKNVDTSASIISRAIRKLWECALPVMYWPFLSSSGGRPNHVWLPPYAFDRTTAWLDNIDRAAELQCEHQNKESREEISHSRGLRMVTKLPEIDMDKQSGAKRFRIAVEGQRFQTIVAGHAVRGRPLCPASVYLECAAMALQLLLSDSEQQHSSLEFQGLDIQAPLGLAPNQQVEVVLHELQSPFQPQGHQYEFAIVSRNFERSDKTVLHAKGRIVRSPGVFGSSPLAVIARMAEKNEKAVETSEAAGTERILSGRVYKLFSRVVEYGSVLQGINSMKMSGSEAIATIAKSADSRPGADESTVLRTCDAVILDGFIQVAGLSMNTGDSVGPREVMICNGIDRSLIAKGFNLEECSSYRVYTNYSHINGKQVMGDVVAWSKDGSPVAAFIGCRFVKLDITRLEKLLDPANARSSNKVAQHTHSSQVAYPVAPKSASSKSSYGSSDGLESDRDVTTAETTPGAVTPLLSSKSQNIRQLLETYTGVAAAVVLDDAVIGDLGLDSLASTELASELQPAGGGTIHGEELVRMTVKQLEEKLHGARGKPIPGHDLVQSIALSHPVHSHRTNATPLMPVSAPIQARPRSRFAKPASKLVPTAASNKMTELLVETTGISPSTIDPQATLQELGVDSLALTEISSVLSEFCAPDFDTDSITGDSKVVDLLRAAG